MGAPQRYSSGTLTLSAGGASTSYFGPNSNLYPITGYLLRVVYTKVNFSNNVTFTFSGEDSGLVLFSVTAGNGDASTIYNPLATSHVATTGAATGNTDALVPIVGERLKLVIAAGGNATTGSFIVLIG